MAKKIDRNFEGGQQIFFTRNTRWRVTKVNSSLLDISLFWRPLQLFIGLGFPYKGPALLEAVAQGVCLFCSCLSGWGFRTRDQLRSRPSHKVFVYLFCSCLSGWGFGTRDLLRSRSLRKVPHCLMFVCLFVYLFCSCLSGWGSLLFIYFVVVYPVGVPVLGTSSARGCRARCLTVWCLFVYFVVVYRVGVPYCLFIL